MRILITLLLMTSSILLKTTAPPPPSPPPSCADELVSFSPCLAYVSLPPNKISNAVSNECCDVVSNAFAENETNCLCYLMKQPLIFGFPLNETRVVSLPFLCVSMINASLDSVCSGSRALPPLRSARGSDISAPGTVTSSPPNNGGPSTPPESIPPEFDNAPPMPPQESNVSAPPSAPPPFLLIAPVEESSLAKDISNSKCWYVVGVIVTSVIFIL